MVSGVKKLFSLGIMLIFTALVIMYPSQSVVAAREAVMLCINVVVPSLFVFMVISGVLIRLGFSHLLARPLEGIMGKLFGVPGQGAICFVLGIMSGYPVGALCVRDMLAESRLSLSDAQKLLGFCNNSGPLFILGAVGAVMYQNRSVGAALYIIHILSCVLTGIIVGRIKKGDGIQRKRERYAENASPLTACFTESVKSAVSSIALVCAYTVIFAVVIELFLKPFDLQNIFGAFFEISTGLRNISLSSFSFNQKMIMTAFFLGFGGLGVHMQVAAIIRNTRLSFSFYVLCKLLQGILSALLMWAALIFFGDKLTGAVVSYYQYTEQMGFGEVMIMSLFCGVCITAIICLIRLVSILIEKVK